VLLGTRIALEAGEAAAEQAAVEVALELTPHERWQRRGARAGSQTGTGRRGFVKPSDRQEAGSAPELADGCIRAAGRVPTHAPQHVPEGTADELTGSRWRDWGN
jgi:hypothetical protein